MSEDWIGTYKLVGKKAVPCSSMEWAIWLETHFDERRVARTEIGECMVSTVFLGLDHGYYDRPNHKPLIFETMAFGPETMGKGLRGEPRMYRPEICSMDRYSTWEESEAGHREVVAEVERYVLDTAVQAEEAIRAIAETTR